MSQLGRMLVIVGLVLTAIGAALLLGGKLGLGKLPGDIAIERRNVSFYFPLATSIIVSLVLTLLLNLLLRKR